MKSSTLLSLGLGLSPVCFATASDNNYSLLSRVSNSSAANTTCASGVHMIVARASTEAPGEGIIGAVATQVQQSVPGSDSEAVDYPATLTDYLNSEASGVAAMKQLIQSYVARCPSSKIVLLGYSQVFSFHSLWEKHAYMFSGSASGGGCPLRHRRKVLQLHNCALHLTSKEQ